jgi:hypothetical protein
MLGAAVAGASRRVESKLNRSQPVAEWTYELHLEHPPLAQRARRGGPELLAAPAAALIRQLGEGWPERGHVLCSGLAIVPADR